MRRLTNQGFGLLETVIALGLGTVLTVATLYVVEQNAQMQKTALRSDVKDSLLNVYKSALRSNQALEKTRIANSGLAGCFKTSITSKAANCTPSSQFIDLRSASDVSLIQSTASSPFEFKDDGNGTCTQTSTTPYCRWSASVVIQPVCILNASGTCTRFPENFMANVTLNYQPPAPAGVANPGPVVKTYTLTESIPQLNFFASTSPYAESISNGCTNNQYAYGVDADGKVVCQDLPTPSPTPIPTASPTPSANPSTLTPSPTPSSTASPAPSTPSPSPTPVVTVQDCACKMKSKTSYASYSNYQEIPQSQGSIYGGMIYYFGYSPQTPTPDASFYSDDASQTPEGWATQTCLYYNKADLAGNTCWGSGCPTPIPKIGGTSDTYSCTAPKIVTY